MKTETTNPIEQLASRVEDALANGRRPERVDLEQLIAIARTAGTVQYMLRTFSNTFDKHCA